MSGKIAIAGQIAEAMRELQRRHDEEEGVEGWAVRVAPTDEWLAVSRRQAPVVKEAIAEG